MNGNDLNARLDDMQRQLDKLFKLFGLPSWAEQERQRLDNEAARGTKADRTQDIFRGMFFALLPADAAQ
jgi:hypothetical protein